MAQSNERRPLGTTRSANMLSYVDKCVTPVPPKDAVEHPAHYTAHPSGVECIQITEHMDFLLGNVVKYVWRVGEKGTELEDLRKARWYLDRKIAQLTDAPTAGDIAETQKRLRDARQKVRAFEDTRDQDQ